MNERELLFQISNIVNGPVSFGQAVEQIARLLERDAGGKGLFLDDPDVDGLLDSFEGTVYTMELRAGDGSLGKLTVVFASDEMQGEFSRLAEFLGEQLGMLVARGRLSERPAQLKREIARIEEDLATRKLMQRAEGLLVARRGLTSAVARRWIAETSRKTSLSKNDAAARIFAYYQATGLF